MMPVAVPPVRVIPGKEDYRFHTDTHMKKRPYQNGQS